VTCLLMAYIVMLCLALVKLVVQPNKAMCCAHAARYH